MTRWLSASEIATAELPGLPRSRENATRWLSRLAASSPDLVRPRKGRGGGLEAHVSALPPAAQAALQRPAVPAAETPGELLAAAREADQRQMLALAAHDLTARQRLVMEARQTLLLAIDAEAMMRGVGRDKAIREFADASRAGRLDPSQAQTVRRANDRAGGEAVISRPTIYRWLRAREDRGVIALAPETTRDKAELPAWFDAFMGFYARPSKPSISAALRDLCAALPAGAPRPTLRQARDGLAKLPALERMRGRAGKLAMRARQAYVARDFSDLSPTSVYSADGKTFDAEVQHPIHGQPFRPEITTIVDVATRCAVGWSAALDESAHAVADALRRACAPEDGRPGGIPALFYTDRGPGYVNEAMTAPLTGLLSRLGVTPMRALPYNSQAKGVIERLNQAYTHAAKSLPTYIGRDMDKEAKLVAFKTTRREIAATGSSRLLLSWTAFLALIDETLAGYNDRPHSSLPLIHDAQLGRRRHMTPRELWDLKTKDFQPIVPTADEAADLFRPWVIRRTRRALVEWLGNSYFAPELEALDGSDVIVGYDIRDARRVLVRAIDEVDGERQPGRLLAVAQFEGHRTRYVPLTAERAAMEKRNKARLGRLERKAGVIEQELSPAALLDHAPAFPAAAFPAPAVAPSNIVDLAPAAIPTGGIASGGNASGGLASAGRPLFRDDTGFAAWIAANPDRATGSDIALLTELLTTPSTQELLRMSGVDLEALRKLVRSSRTAGAA